MAELFGFTFSLKKKAEKPIEDQSFVQPNNDDGAAAVAAGGLYGTYVDLDGTVRTETELITKYRDMSIYPEVDMAIDDIVNEAVIDSHEIDSVKLKLDDIENIPDNIKDAIQEEFKEVLRLLEYRSKGYDIFKRWYIDGRLLYHTVIDPSRPRDGIKEVRYIDPRKIRKIREIERKPVKQGGQVQATVPVVKSEYYVYNERGFVSRNPATGVQTGSDVGATGLRISKDAIVQVTSGLTSTSGDMVLSYLHKAIKVLNQLASMEDSLIIYRISRAPDRRVFYIDVGNLPKPKAEQYLRDIMTRFKNRVVYNAEDGTVRDDRKFMCFALDTKIPLMDGRTLTLQEIMDEHEAGRKNWVYSCDPKTGEALIPGPVSWAGVTKRGSDVVRVTFDNGKSVVCTPDHKFPVLGRGFIEAQDLTDEEIIGGHRAVAVERLDELMDVGCLTIDAEETYHSHHTYLLDAGVYTKNTMMEDFWLPRREGGRGTEISQLAGGQNLGQIDDVVFFQQRLYKSLNVPISRLDPSSVYSLGRASEINRDEIKFSKLVNRMRARFSTLFTQMLQKQCVLKGILASDEWDEIAEMISYEWSKDNYYDELKNQEVWRGRLETLEMMADVAGKYLSHDWVRRNILRQTDEEIEEQDAMIEREMIDPRFNQSLMPPSDGAGMERDDENEDDNGQASGSSSDK